ncbi:MAG: hypothetical protein GY951_02975 [Psychromonas sp.]|nr:hypothetical protein [Psychromonas sp.]
MLNSKDIQAIYQQHNKIVKIKPQKTTKKESPPKEATILAISNALKNKANSRRMELVRATGLSAKCIERSIRYLLSVEKITKKDIGFAGPHKVYAYSLA